MTFYAVSLDRIDTVFQRGKLDDIDIITFQVLVNNLLRAQAAGTGVGITGESNPMGTSAIDQSSGPMIVGGIVAGQQFGWLAGPLSLAPGDGLKIAYSGTNVSDSQLGDPEMTKIEIGILDQLFTAGTAAVAGEFATAINKALSFIGDPVGSLLGVKAEGPCNGTVFGDGIGFDSGELADLPFDQQADVNFVPDGGMANPTGAKATVFMEPPTGTYTDEATHNPDICGHLAETKVLFTIHRLSSVSLRAYGGKRFGLRTLTGGVRQLGQPPFTVRKLLQLNQ